MHTWRQNLHISLVFWQEMVLPQQDLLVFNTFLTRCITLASALLPPAKQTAAAACVVELYGVVWCQSV